VNFPNIADMTHVSQMHTIKKKRWVKVHLLGQEYLWNINLSINNTLSNINKNYYGLAVWCQYKSKDHSKSSSLEEI